MYWNSKILLVQPVSLGLLHYGYTKNTIFTPLPMTIALWVHKQINYFYLCQWLLNYGYIFLPWPMTIELWVHIFTLATNYCIVGTYFYPGQWLLYYGYIFFPWPMIIALWAHIFTLANDCHPICSIRPHGSYDILFRVTPVNTILHEVIDRQSRWSTDTGINKYFSIISIHPWPFYFWIECVTIGPIHPTENCCKTMYILCKIPKWCF
jgi:hypothetical protein